jgi:type I restriction enzyme S subunit
MTFQKLLIKDCCTIVSGSTPRTDIPEYWNGDILWATPKDLSDRNCQYIAETNSKITQEGFNSCSTSLLPPYSVLLSSRAPIGLVAVNTVPMCTNQGFKSLIPDSNKVYYKYLYYWLLYKKEYLQSLGNGATFKELSKNSFERVEIQLPSVTEQKRIVAILDKAEEIKRKREESLKLADEFLKSVFVDMFGDPVTNPKGWERAPLGRLTKIDAPMVDPKKKEYLDLIHIAPNNIEKCTGQLLPAKTAREDNLISGKFLFTEKHVLYSKIRPYLRKGALPDFSGLCSADMYPIEPIKNVLTREYLLFILLSDAFDDYTKTIPGRANIPKINRTELNAYETIVPDYALQKDFSKIYRKIKERREHLANTDFENKLFGSLSQKAFNGDL